MEDASIASFSSELYARFLLDHPPVTLKLLRMLGTRHLSMINTQILAGCSTLWRSFYFYS